MMIINKSFKINVSHITRNCYSERCKYSLHAHTAKIEVFIEGNKIDNAGMILDYTILKKVIKPFIDIHDNTVLIWKYDSEEYKNIIKSKTDNWIELSFNPTSELLAAYFQLHFDSILKRVKLKNNEDKDLSIIKTRYYETGSSWAEANNYDVLKLVTDEKQVLMMSKVGNLVLDKMKKFEDNIGASFFGDKPIELDKPKLQVTLRRR